MLKQIKSEKGSVVLLALMVLMLVTLFGISALNTSDTELKVSHNGRCYKQNIYRAEGIIMEVAQILETSNSAALNPVLGVTPAWLTNGSTFNPENKSSVWDTSNSGVPTTFNTDAGFAVVFEGIAPGGSLTMTATQMWQYGVYGKSQLCNGDIGVVAGYRRRF